MMKPVFTVISMYVSHSLVKRIEALDYTWLEPFRRVASFMGEELLNGVSWIAQSAPSHLKATFFAILASFTNLALSASNLGTKYLNEVFVITREVRNDLGEIKTSADYSDLGLLLIVVCLLTLVVPILITNIVKKLKLLSY